MKSRAALLLVLLVMLAAAPFAQAQAGPQRSAIPAGTRSNPETGVPITDIRDGGFETGGIWRERSNPFPTINCTVESCTPGSEAGPRTDTHFTWFGDSAAALNQFVEQSVVLPRTAAIYLIYFYRVGTYNAAGNPKFKVLIDGHLVQNVPITGLTAGYQSVVLNISAYGDGKAHKIRFQYKQTAGGENNISLDDVEFESGTNLALFNPDFETGSLGEWTLTHGTGDGVKCNTATKTFSYTGTCAFVFNGSGSEKATLSQEFGFLRRLPPAPGRAPGHYKVYLGAYVKAGPSATGSIKMVLTLSNEAKLKSSVSLAGTGAYAWKQTPPRRFSSEHDIAYLKITIKNTSASGKIYIDDVQLGITSDYS